jgi:predicted TIM-barrel fold metal-dependent hydrolase
MPMPSDVGVIDLMMGIPSGDPQRWYDFLRTQLLDRESREDFEFPAEYMFHDVPKFQEHLDDPVSYLLDQMDGHGIAMAMVGTSFKNDQAQQAIKDHPTRFFGSFEVDPNRGMESVRELEAAVRELGVKAATAFPAGLTPQVPINDKKFYPLYAKCVELDIPICVCAGVPGPRVPFGPQDVALIDEVCWFFPELKFVTRHGCEPWADLAVKLMLKWPNLHYSTSAFAPKYYPADVVRYANTRGADKVMYAGYFPMGLTLDRIFSELPDVPFRDHVWPKFLRDNAVRVFKLDQPPAA